MNPLIEAYEHKRPAAVSESIWGERVDPWEQIAASPAFQRIAARVIEAADPRRDDRVIDLGAGTGLLALRLADQVESVIAVDFAAPMLERCSERASRAGVSNVETLAADLRCLPLPDESATLVVSNYAFHHLSDGDKELALGEARRVLVPGGRLVISDMMFSLSLKPRDRALIIQKVGAIARRGPAGIVRLARNAFRVARGSWEHPAPAELWRGMLERRHFADISVSLLEHEAGLACASRPQEVEL